MENSDLINFIRKGLNSGRDEELIRQQLIEAKWDPRDIDEAFIRLHFGNNKSAKSKLNHLLSPSQLFKSAIAVYKTKLSGIIKLVIFFKILYLPAFIAIPYFSSSYSFWQQNFTGQNPDLQNSIYFILFSVLFIIFSSIITAWETISLIRFLTPDYNEVFSQNLKNSFKLITSYWWLLLIQIPILISGTFLFFIPGVIFAVWFSFAPFILILENIKGIDALYVSREIVRGHFWELLIRFFAINSVFIAGFLVLNFIPQLISFSAGPKSLYLAPDLSVKSPAGPESIFTPQFLTSFIVLIVQSLTVVSLWNIYMILLYKNTKEAYDRSYPLPSKRSKIIIILPAAIGLLIALFSFGFVFFLIFADPLNRNKNTGTNNQLINKITPVWYPEKIITPIIQPETETKTYENPVCSFLVNYSGDFDVQIADDMQNITFHSSPDHGTDVIINCAHDEPPPYDYTISSSEDFYIDGIKGTLYHLSLVGGVKKDQIIVKDPDAEHEISIYGYGESFDQIIFSFKFTGKG